MTLSTFSRVFFDTSPLSCSTLSTVPFVTPAALATSLIVIMEFFICIRLHVKTSCNIRKNIDLSQIEGKYLRVRTRKQKNIVKFANISPAFVGNFV